MSYKVDCPHCGWVVRSPVKIHAPVMECSACGQTFEAIFAECDDDIISEEEAPGKEDQKVIPVASGISWKSWILISVVVMLLGGAGISAKYIFDSRKAKLAEKAAEELQTKEYEKQFHETMKGMALSSLTAQKACETHLKKWLRILQTGNGNSDYAIRLSLAENERPIALLKDSKQFYEGAMQHLSKPPPKYRDAYDKLVLFQAAANSLIDLAVYPSDMDSYPEAVEVATNSLSKQLKELGDAIPE